MRKKYVWKSILHTFKIYLKIVQFFWYSSLMGKTRHTPICCPLYLQDLFQERSRMSSAQEANTQRLRAALRAKDNALKVHKEGTISFLSYATCKMLHSRVSLTKIVFLP